MKIVSLPSVGSLVLCSVLSALGGCDRADTTPAPESAAESEATTPVELAERPDVDADAPHSGAEAAATGAEREAAAEAEQRRLPAAMEASESETGDAANGSAEDSAAAADDDLPDWRAEQGPTGEEIAREAFEPPPETKSLSKDGRLWVDRQRQRVYIDGYVTLKRGPLEMFACPVGTKEHESIVAALAKSREVHAALLTIGAEPGTPVRFQPEFLPPTGQVIRVYVCWYDEQDEFHAVDARNWIKDLETQQAMEVEWVFAGSGFWQDPEDKREYYQADSGDMICVSNFSSAMLDVAIASSAQTGSLRFEPMESEIPALKTPVRLVLVPVPNPSDDSDEESGPQTLAPPDPAAVPRAG